MVFVGYLTAQWWIQGRGTAAPPPIFKPNWGLKTTPPPHHPLYLRVWMTGPRPLNSQGLDPALLLTPMGVACIFAICMTENRVSKNRERKIESLGQSLLIKTNSDMLHHQLNGDMDYINCWTKIAMSIQSLVCQFQSPNLSITICFDFIKPHWIVEYHWENL